MTEKIESSTTLKRCTTLGFSLKCSLEFLSGTRQRYNITINYLFCKKKALLTLKNCRGDVTELRTQPLFIKYNILIKLKYLYYFKLLQFINESYMLSTATKKHHRTGCVTLI